MRTCFDEIPSRGLPGGSVDEEEVWGEGVGDKPGNISVVASDLVEAVGEGEKLLLFCRGRGLDKTISFKKVTSGFRPFSCLPEELRM